MMIIIGLILGVAITMGFFWFRAEKLMMKEDRSKHSFEETVELFTEAVEKKDWKLLHIHDLQAKMKANGYDVIEARVYDVCRPAYASQILKQDHERIFSSMMPCRVAIYKKSDGKTYISRMNSGLVARPMKGVVPKVMSQAAADVEDIILQLK